MCDRVGLEINYNNDCDSNKLRDVVIDGGIVNIPYLSDPEQNKNSETPQKSKTTLKIEHWRA